MLFLVMHSAPFLLIATVSQRGTSAQGELHVHKNLSRPGAVPFSIGVASLRAIAHGPKTLFLPLCAQPAERPER